MQVLPNTDADSQLEYADIQNTSCTDIDISGWVYADLVRTYTLPILTLTG